MPSQHVTDSSRFCEPLPTFIILTHTCSSFGARKGRNVYYIREHGHSDSKRKFAILLRDWGCSRLSAPGGRLSFCPFPFHSLLPLPLGPPQANLMAGVNSLSPRLKKL